MDKLSLYGPIVDDSSDDSSSSSDENNSSPPNEEQVMISQVLPAVEKYLNDTQDNQNDVQMENQTVSITVVHKEQEQEASPEDVQ